MEDEKVETAITGLEKFKQQEEDGGHKDSLENVIQMVRGVYDHYDEPPSKEELETVEEVLEAIDPESQWWHEDEYVEDKVGRGLEWCEHGKKYADNPRIW